MSEWYHCTKCGTEHENMCACPEPFMKFPQEELNLTPKEAQLILDLLQLWDINYEDNNCARACVCRKCMQLEKSGEHSADTFESLKRKASSI